MIAAKKPLEIIFLPSLSKLLLALKQCIFKNFDLLLHYNFLSKNEKKFEATYPLTIKLFIDSTLFFTCLIWEEVKPKLNYHFILVDKTVSIFISEEIRATGLQPFSY